LVGTQFTVRELRGRDVMAKLKGKVDREVLEVLVALAEQQYAMDKGMGEIAAMLDQMARINSMMVDVAGEMKKKVLSHRRSDDDLKANDHDA
jgi:hypothetical protein